MTPPTLSATVPPHTSAQSLLRQGHPFVEFPRFSILELQRRKDHAGNAVPFSEWLTKRLQIGQPFIIQDFNQLETWNAPFFEIEKLIELSTKKSTRFSACDTDTSLTGPPHRHTHPKLQLRQGPQLHATQVRRLCASVLPRIPEPLRSRPAMSTGMARTMSQDTTDRGAMGWPTGLVPMAASMRQK